MEFWSYLYSENDIKNQPQQNLTKEQAAILVMPETTKIDDSPICLS
jgi:hypothetical protein